MLPLVCNANPVNAVIESKTNGRIVILKATLHQLDGEYLPILEASSDRESEEERLCHQSSVCVFVIENDMNPA